jgi:hypothetical protein
VAPRDQADPRGRATATTSMAATPLKPLGKRSIGIFSADLDSFDFKMRKPEQAKTPAAAWLTRARSSSETAPSSPPLRTFVPNNRRYSVRVAPVLDRKGVALFDRDVVRRDRG